MQIIKKSDFVELDFTGRTDGQVFDSTLQEELRKMDPKAKAKKIIIAVGEKMILPGLDHELEGKEVGKEYHIHIQAKDGFGLRKKELVKMLPLSVFSAQKVQPFPGAVFTMDGMYAKVLTVSGARVITDFNNPLAGKELDYSFKVNRIVTDIHEKTESLLIFFFHFKPEFHIGDSVVIKGPKILEPVVKHYSSKFKELIGKDLSFEETKTQPKSDGKEAAQQSL